MWEIGINVGIGVLFLCILGIWFLQFLQENAVDATKSGIIGNILKKEENLGEPFYWKEGGTIIVWAVLVRLVVYIIGIGVQYGVESYDGGDSLGVNAFLDSWLRWDGFHYINLAKLGYKAYVEDGQHLFLVFFPLYPWLIRVLHGLVQDWRICALIVSNIAYIIGSVFFYGVVKEEYGKETGVRSFWLLSLFPFSLFFGSIMTESLFFCLLSAGFFFVKRHNWCLVGITGMLCALCRIQGFLLIIVAFVEFVTYYGICQLFREKKFRQIGSLLVKKCTWLLLIVVGVGAYFGLNTYVEGDPFRFRVYQKQHWYHTTTLPSKSVIEILSNMVSKNVEPSMKWCIWYPEWILFLLAILVILYGVKRRNSKYTAFLIAYTVLNYSVTYLISGGRYMSCALPLFFLLAQWTGKKSNIWYYGILTCFGAGMVVYLTGYLTGWQIM